MATFLLGTSHPVTDSIRRDELKRLTPGPIDFRNLARHADYGEKPSAELAGGKGDGTGPETGMRVAESAERVGSFAKGDATSDPLEMRFSRRHLQPLGRESLSLNTQCVAVSSDSYAALAARFGRFGRPVWRIGGQIGCDPRLTSVTVVPVVPSLKASRDPAGSDGGKDEASPTSLFEGAWRPDLSSAAMVHAACWETVSQVCWRAAPPREEWPDGVEIAVRPCGWIAPERSATAGPSATAAAASANVRTCGPGDAERRAGQTMSECGLDGRDGAMLFVRVSFERRDDRNRHGDGGPSAAAAAAAAAKRAGAGAAATPNRTRGLVGHRAGAGIRNPGATCHLAAVIQALPPPRGARDAGAGGGARAAARALASLLRRVGGPSGVTGDVAVLARALKSPFFDPFLQQDAHETLTVLLDALGRCDGRTTTATTTVTTTATTTATAAATAKTPLEALLTGATTSTLTCGGCGAVSVVREPCVGLSVEIPRASDAGGCVTLEDCLAAFVREESIADSDRGGWACESCADPAAPVTKRLAVATLPHVVIVHLKRFSNNSGAASDRRRGKVTARVAWDPSRPLDLGAILLGGAPAPGERGAMHRCVAIIEHRGERAFGHYTCVVRDGPEGEWLRFNDEILARVGDASPVSDDAYIAFFEQVEPGGAMDDA